MCEMLEAVKEQKLSKCPYHRATLAGDEIYDWCELSDNPCMVAYGDYGCEEWEDIQAEWINEEHEIKPKPRQKFRIIKEG